MLKPDSALDKDRRSAKYDHPTFEHRHFATLAAIIKEMGTVHNGEQGFIDVRSDVAAHFANQLARTNPKFDRARFLRACGF